MMLFLIANASIIKVNSINPNYTQNKKHTNTTIDTRSSSSSITREYKDIYYITKNETKINKATLEMTIDATGNFTFAFRLMGIKNMSLEFFSYYPKSTEYIDFVIKDKISIQITLTTSENLTSGEINLFINNVLNNTNQISKINTLKFERYVYNKVLNEHLFFFEGKLESSDAINNFVLNKIRKNANSSFVATLSNYLSVNLSNSTLKEEYTFSYIVGENISNLYIVFTYDKYLFERYKYKTFTLNLTNFLNSSASVTNFDLGNKVESLEVRISILAKDLQIVSSQNNKNYKMSFYNSTPYSTATFIASTDKGENLSIPIISFRGIFGDFPYLKVYKMSSKSVVNPGEELVINIYISNTGYGPAYNITLKDKLPDGFTLANGSLTTHISYIDKGANFKRVWTYTIKSTVEGEHPVPNGTVIYYDENNTRYQTIIRPAFSILVRENNSWIYVVMFLLVFTTLVILDIYQYMKKKKHRNKKRYRK